MKRAMAAAIAASLLGGLSAAPALAQNSSSAPVDISADEQETISSQCKTIFRGAVEVLQETSRLRAAKMTLYNQKKAKSGDGSGCGNVDRVEAEGEVFYVTPKQTVRGDRATYDYASNTIVVLTADHGDLDGAHRMHSKGATSYREQNNVPLIVVHPAYTGGKRCKAVTSHLDLAPTLVGLTHASAEKKATITKTLPGKDFSSVLRAPDKASAAAIRDGALFCYNMFAYIDGDFMQKAVDVMSQPDGKAKLQMAAKEGLLRPDLSKRGAIRSVFDGRYQFTRYFSPKQHNRPTSLEALFRLNDVELFDLERDPLETRNLAVDAKQNGELLQSMNEKLNRLLDTEVGEDVGQMLPGGVDAGWVATDAVKDV